MKEEFKEMMSFLMKTFMYWDNLSYTNKYFDHKITAESKLYQIEINWYGRKSGGLVWSSRGSFDKFILTFVVKEGNMHHHQTPYKGSEYDNTQDIINELFKYLKKDDEYKKHLRISKLERIVKD